MIYSVGNKSAYTECIALFGKMADAMLEATGITLYENTIAIGENEYKGVEAEAFLNENGIFLYEDHIVLKGNQVKNYRAMSESLDDHMKELEKKASKPEDSEAKKKIVEDAMKTLKDKMASDMNKSNNKRDADHRPDRMRYSVK